MQIGRDDRFVPAAVLSWRGKWATILFTAAPVYRKLKAGKCFHGGDMAEISAKEELSTPSPSPTAFAHVPARRGSEIASTPGARHPEMVAIGWRGLHWRATSRYRLITRACVPKSSRPHALAAGTIATCRCGLWAPLPCYDA